MYRDILCDEDNSTAPRVGCGCRGCYMARENALDPRLIALVHPTSSAASPSVAAAYVHRHLSAYLSGRLDYGALHLEIIKSLMKIADDTMEQHSKLLFARPPMVIASHVPSWTIEEMLREVPAMNDDGSKPPAAG